MRYLLALWITAFSAHAEVYRCVQNGHSSFSDRPCAQGTPALSLPPLNVEAAQPAASAADVAKQYDARLASEKQRRNQQDAEYVAQQQALAQRNKAVRQAIFDHQVIEGMTRSEVESAMGAADQSQVDRYIYWRDGQRTTIHFGPAGVSRVVVKSHPKGKAHVHHHR